MAPDPRVMKAFNAMKDLGIPWGTVKPVLRHLLKLYDRNWELIEEDNYRTLADAIFEWEDKPSEDKKDPITNDGTESPLKKPHLGQYEDQVFSTMDNADMISGLEDGEVPQTSGGSELEPSQSRVRDGMIKPSFHSLHPLFRDNGNDTISSHLIPRGGIFSSGRASRALYSNQAIDGPSLVYTQREKIPKDHHNEDLIKHKANQSIDGLSHFVIPPPEVHSDSLEGSSSRDRSAKILISRSDKNNRDDCSEYDYGTKCKSSVNIASSPRGEVKISLNCNSALGQPNFQTPNLDALLKFVENKYLRSYKIVGPQFSVMRLLKELCESCLELGTNTIGKCVINKSPGSFQRTKGPNRDFPETIILERDLNRKVPSFSGSSDSLGLVHAEQQPTVTARKRPFHRINDISKGTERVSISLIHEIGDEHRPDFVYVPQNIIYQNAYVHVSLARIADEDCCSSCIGDCLSSSVPCACARDTGGEYAYTEKGLLKEDFLTSCISMNQDPQNHYHFYCQDCPLERAKNGYNPEQCKGHLVRKFIKECWRKCGCNMQCGNRVVQRGITCRLEVFLTSEGKGWGLRTLEDLPKGAFICEYIGEILTNLELYERNKRHCGNDRHTYPVLLDADWGSEGVLKDEDALCLDATYYGNIARFINHRCFDGNLLEIPVEVENPDHHYYHLAFFTKRKVDALEELTWDYGIDFNDQNHPIKAFQCGCGSAFCRDIKGKRKKNKYISV